MSFFLAPAHVQLRKECDGRFPNRDRASDGWIGDPSHAARKSSHNPCWTCPGKFKGIVLGLDVDISPDGRANADLRTDLLKAVIGDRRVWYVISNGKICSRTTGWTWLTYSGHPHDGHVHISLLDGSNGNAFDTSPWFDVAKPLPRKTIDLSVLQTQLLRALDVEPGPVQFRHAVRFTQLALNKKYDADLATDGIAGRATLTAWGRHERRTDGRGRPRIPDEDSLARLVKGTRLSWAA